MQVSKFFMVEIEDRPSTFVGYVKNEINADLQFNLRNDGM